MHYFSLVYRPQYNKFQSMTALFVWIRTSDTSSDDDVIVNKHFTWLKSDVETRFTHKHTHKHTHTHEHTHTYPYTHTHIHTYTHTLRLTQVHNA